MMATARRVTVTGRVQGVFFRAWTQQQGQQLGVHGWVRNCPDGSVEAHVEGSEDAVMRIVEMLRQGPAHARVDHVQVSEAEVGRFSRFEVRH